MRGTRQQLDEAVFVAFIPSDLSNIAGETVAAMLIPSFNHKSCYLKIVENIVEKVIEIVEFTFSLEGNPTRITLRCRTLLPGGTGVSACSLSHLKSRFHYHRTAACVFVLSSSLSWMS